MFKHRMKCMLGALVGLAILSGCASREPLDYLPEAPNYLAFNMEKIRSAEGTRRATEALEKLQQDAGSWTDPSMSRAYVAIEGGPGRNGTWASVAVGSAGFAERQMNKLRKEGGTEKKVHGRTVITSGPVNMSAVGETGLLIFGSDDTLDRMIRTSKKKAPGAATSSDFQTLRKLSDSHAVAIVADASPLLSAASPAMQQVRMINPKGADALQQVELLSLTGDWEAQPELRLTLHKSGEEGRAELATLVNFGLGMVAPSMAGNLPSGLATLLKGLKAETNADGVTMSIAVPKGEADQFLQALESGDFKMPDGPRRQRRP